MLRGSTVPHPSLVLSFLASMFQSPPPHPDNFSSFQHSIIPEPQPQLQERTALTQEDAEKIVSRYEDGEFFEGDLAISRELLLAHYGDEASVSRLIV